MDALDDFQVNKPDSPEFCYDEIHDLLFELVRRELKAIPGDVECRRKELCEAILAVNKENGERARICAAACEILKNWKAQEAQISALEKLGFTITKGRKHLKLRWHDSPYFKMLSATPSDNRSGANSVAEFMRTFF